ncbi:MAG: CHAT domain-containing protein, partial [Gemmataceae bacterium]|nr:CHAT domain-containing protein [Gemmataceae bacterium]
MPAPYHVRLAVSQYGDQFRAELFTEDLGDTEGDVLAELPPSLGEWVPFLAQGADLPPDAARQLGKDLFAALLGQPENAKKWTEVLDRARKAGQPVRLLIDATTDAVRDLPYGLLCEPHDDWFLFRGGKAGTVRFVRILRRCSPRPLNLGTRPRVLVAVAEPVSADVPAFDAPGRLKGLCAALAECADVRLVGPDGVVPLAGVTDFAPFTKTTRDGLKAALASEVEVFHLLAHGHGAGVLLCHPDGTPAETTAGELAEWCGGGTAGLAFLQVCKAGQTGGRGGFGGVAQQLLSPHGGNLAAVVASTFPLDAEHSTTAAAAFYRALAAGKSPEEALAAERAETDWCWAFLELWARPGALGGTQQRAAFQFVSPYRGLSSYTERDADLFFGRRSEVTELLQILRTEPAVGVVGDSGSGKTSLLQAGLVYSVRQGGLAGLDRWRIVNLRPGYHPAQSLLTALRPGKPVPPNPQLLAAALKGDDRPLMVIFDQFEEVFTLAADPAEGRMMTEALADAVADRPDRFRLVVGMRSEFLGQAAGLPGLSKLLRRPWVLRPPGSTNLREIVTGPAEHCGYSFEGPLADGNPAHATGLLDRILADPLLATTDGATPSLPLLQFALERLWLKAVESGRPVFTHAGVDALGGLGSAIAQHAENVFMATPTATGLGAGARALAEHVITALVSGRGTRQPRSRADLQAETGKPDETRTVIDYLVGERLLTVRADPADPAASLVDLAHEAVVRHWDRLRGWLAEDPVGRAMREEFRTAVEKWENGFAGVPPKSPYGLPGADVIRNYLAWIDTHNPQLPPLAQEFVAAMRRYVWRQRRIRGAVMATLAGLTVAACGLAVYADDLKAGARKSEADAKKSAEEAQRNEAAAKAEKRVSELRYASLVLEEGVELCERGRPRIGMLRIARSLQLCPTGPEAADLRRVIRTNLAAWAPYLMCLDGARQLPGPTRAASPDGAAALVALGPGVAQLYDTDTGEPIGKRLELWDGLVPWGRVVRLPAGGWAVLTNGSKHARVWDPLTGHPRGPELTVPDGEGEFYHAALSPDGRRVAAGTDRGKAWVWDATTGAVVAGPLAHEGAVHDLAFSGDGKLLATGCDWDAGRRARRKAAAVSADDDRSGGVVRLWDAATGELEWWHAADEPVTVVGLPPGPDPRYVAFGHTTIRVWDRDRATPVGDRFVEPESVDAVVFDPTEEGRLIVCRSSGHVTIRYFLATHPSAADQLSPQGLVAAVGVRPKPDGRLFTLNRDGTQRLWHPPVFQGPLHQYPCPDAVLSVAFGPQSRTVATACRNGSVYVWDADIEAGWKAQLTADREPGAAARAMAQVRFSPDGGRVIAQDLYYANWVWDAATGMPLAAPPGTALVGVAE